MTILAGIDEAGYGPLLGPLVVSCTAFSVPDSLVSADMWAVLKKSVAKNRKHKSVKLLIADSKKVYSKSIGIKYLQRGVLSMLKCLGSEPQTYNDVLSYLCPDCLGRLKNYPWHKADENQRIECDRADIRIASNVLTKDFERNDIKPLLLRSICLDTVHYNALIEKVNNKANVLFSAAADHLYKLWNDFPKDNLQVLMDRQGGRSHYRPALQRIFSDVELSIIAEKENCSTYELKKGSRTMRIHFVVGGDDKFLPVALASMLCKYVREILVADINRYFLKFEPSLKPTAGYFKDGRRFLADIKTYAPHVKYDANQLIRCR